MATQLQALGPPFNSYPGLFSKVRRNRMLIAHSSPAEDAATGLKQ